jgi:hypothetical protein
MANRLPFECWEDILRMNDDEVDFWAEMRHPGSRFCPRPKPCARAFGLACTQWRSFVLSSPRLWAITVRIYGPRDSYYSSIANGHDGGLKEAEELISQPSTNCDMDVILHFHDLSQRSVDIMSPDWMKKVFNVIIPSSRRWRSLIIRGNAVFFNFWMEHQRRIPILSRLLSLNVLFNNAKVPDFGSNLRCPNLRVALLNTQSPSGIGSLPIDPTFLSQAEILRLHKGRPVWLNQIQDQFPWLQYLRIDTCSKKEITIKTPKLPSGVAPQGQPNLFHLDLIVSYQDFLDALNLLPVSRVKQIDVKHPTFTPGTDVDHPESFETMRPLATGALKCLTAHTYSQNILSFLQRMDFTQLRALDLLLVERHSFSLAMSLPNLETLSINVSAGLSLKELFAPNLQELSLAHVTSFGPTGSHGSDTSKSIGVLGSLRKLTLIGSQGNITIGKALQGVEMPNLHELDVSKLAIERSPDLSETWKAAIAKWPRDIFAALRELRATFPLTSTSPLTALLDRMECLESVTLAAGEDTRLPIGPYRGSTYADFFRYFGWEAAPASEIQSDGTREPQITVSLLPPPLLPTLKSLTLILENHYTKDANIICAGIEKVISYRSKLNIPLEKVTLAGFNLGPEGLESVERCGLLTDVKLIY